MDRLPDEIILQILSYLEVRDIVDSQYLSRRYLYLSRDTAVWKQLCFENSRAEAQRRRQLLSPAGDARLAALRDAVNSIAEADGSAPSSSPSSPSTADARVRAYANWDPSYPHEQIDFYQEYIPVMLLLRQLAGFQYLSMLLRNPSILMKLQGLALSEDMTTASRK